MKIVMSFLILPGLVLAAADLPYVSEPHGPSYTEPGPP